jgi:hypothetical protein
MIRRGRQQRTKRQWTEPPPMPVFGEQIIVRDDFAFGAAPLEKFINRLQSRALKLCSHA